MIKDHKRECNDCEYNGEQCPICKKHLNAYEVEKAMSCPCCGLNFHKGKCMAAHKQKEHMETFEENKKVKVEIERKSAKREEMFWANWYQDDSITDDATDDQYKYAVKTWIAG